MYDYRIFFCCGASYCGRFKVCNVSKDFCVIIFVSFSFFVP